MDALDADREIGFCFIWKIQNYNFCFRKNMDLFYDSPTFELDENSTEKWSFRICPKRCFRHDSIRLLLQRCTEGKDRFLTLEVSIYDGRGSFKKFDQRILTFNSDTRILGSNLNLILNKEILKTYPNNDSLTIKCVIWQLKEVLKTRRCYARTIIGAERIHYPCTLEGFEEFENGIKLEKRITILSEFPFAMDFYSTEETYAENKIEVKIKPIDPKKEFFSTCEMSLIDADGNMAHSVRDEFHFETSNPEQVWTFPFIQASKVLSNKNLFLPNGILHLSCEFVVSSGVKYNEVERTEYRTRNNHLMQCNDKTTDSDFPSGALKDSLQRFYEERKFSDTTIRTPSKEFPVHKTILCARSEVFTAMFVHDTKENQTSVIEIKDVDDDTVSRMLLFLYTDTVEEDLDTRKACSLYFAADKYEIVALKRKCADFLKGNITVNNVCAVLVLADMHQDVKFKSFAQQFVLEHFEEIVNTADWKEIVVNQPPLAAETMHEMLKRSISKLSLK